jgi:hypothetical protein
MTTPLPRRLAPLALAVLAAHLALLGLAPPALVQPPVQATRAFDVRQIAPPAAAPQASRPAMDAPAPAAAPAPRPAAVARPREAAPPAAASEASAPPPTDTSVAAAPAPVPTAPPATDTNIAPVQLHAVPAPVRVHYEVTLQARGLSVPARAQLDWRHDGAQYEARLEVGGALIPKRVQRSTGSITADGLAPGRFSDQGRRGEEATHFERGEGKLVFSNNRPQAQLLAGMQDRLSVVVQLTMMVAGDPGRYTPGTAIAIPTASTREAETWVFTVQGEEDLELPGGNLRALKLLRNPRKEFDQQVELWLAPRLDYAPVRLRLTNHNGDSSDLRWSSTDKG